MRDVPHRANPDADYGHGLRAISQQELGNFQVDNRGRIYWEGRPLEFARPFKFTFWQGLAAVIVTVAAFVGAFIAAWQWGCDLGWLAGGMCPQGLALHQQAGN